MAIQMTRAQYEAKYGVKAPVSSPVAPTTTPVKMTQAEFDAKYKTQPQPEKIGLGQSILQGAANPFLKVVSGVANAANTVVGELGSEKAKAKAKEIQTQGIDYGPLGTVKPVGSGFDINKGFKANVRPVLDSVGTGAEIGSYAVGAPGVKTVVKEGFKGAVKTATKQGLKYGLGGGLLQGVGTGLQKEDATVGSVLKDTAVSGGAGLLGGGVVGATTGILGYAFRSVPKLINYLRTSKSLTPDEVALRDAVDTITPAMTKTEKQAAIQQGRGKTTPMLKKTVIEPSERDLEIANVVKGVVGPKKSAVDNANAVRAQIAKTGDEVQAGLKQANLPVDENRFREFLTKVKDGSRVIFGSDKSLESSYDAITEEFMRQVSLQPKTAEGLLIARKNFDRVINQKFPGLLSQEAGDNVRRNAVLDIRRAANDYIADLLPEGNLFKEQLRQMNLMYDAVEMLSKKGAPQVGTNPFSRAAKNASKNPIVQVGLGAAGLGAGAAGINKIIGD